MKKLIVLIALLTVSVSAQDLTILKVKRFSPTLSSQNQYKGWTTAPSLKISQTDTTEIFTLSSSSPIDTLIESVVFSSVADTLKMSIYAQYTLRGRPAGTGIIDSLVYNNLATSVGVPMKGKRLWFTRPAGADGVRLIIATAATMNHGGYLATPTKTYNAAIVTRMK